MGEIVATLQEACMLLLRSARRHPTTMTEKIQRRLLAVYRCGLFWKVLEKLFLGSLRLLDMSLGGIYFVLDLVFEGLEASKAKDIFIRRSLYSASSSSSSSSSSLRSSRTSSFSSGSSSSDSGAENDILGLSSSVSPDDLDMLSLFSSAALGSYQRQTSKPRRAGIIAERRNAKNCGDGSSCACWGWEVDEEPLDGGQFPMHDTLPDLHFHDANEYNIVGGSASNDVKARWSECQCRDCRKLWMPMSKARSNLYVQQWNANEICDVQQAENITRKLPCEELSGTLKYQPPRERKLEDGHLRSSGTLASSIGDGSAGHRDRDSNLIAGAELLWQSSARGRSRNQEKEREATGVIFLHGLFSSSDFWFESNIIPNLDDEIKAKHVILAPDLLGCGRSPRPLDSVYTLRDQLDALENSIVRKHNVISFHLVAHSMGTILALALAARFPHRVRSISLIAPVYVGYTDPEGVSEEILSDCNSVLPFENLFSLMAIRSLTALQYYNISRCFGHIFLARHRYLVPIFQRLLRNRWPRSFVRDYLAVTHDAAWHMVHNTMIGGSHALVPALRKLRDSGVRVFVLHGTDDTSCPFKQSVLMHQHFENVVLAPVQGKGHVDVVLGRTHEVLPLLEEEIRLGDRHFSKCSERS